MDWITVIPRDRMYWLVRTDGGHYYDDFINGRFVAIGWDAFNNIDWLRAIKSKQDEKIFMHHFKLAYPDKQRPKHDLNQIRKFIGNMQIGDLVIAPSVASYKISFGIVESDVYVDEPRLNKEQLEKGVCPFGKRRRIKWIKTIRRDDLDPYLYKLFFSHHTITNASDYASIIDRTIHSLFIKGEKAHIVLGVKTKEHMLARDLTALLDNIFNSADDFNKTVETKIDFDKVEMKLNVQSPGVIELLSSIEGMLVIVLILNIVVGGKYNFKISKAGIEGKVDTPGLIEKIIQYKERISQKDKKLQILHDLVSKLKIELPKELQQDDEESKK